VPDPRQIIKEALDRIDANPQVYTGEALFESDSG
jgi:hypothetical protein